MPTLSVRRTVAAVLPFALLGATGIADAAPLNVSSIVALSPEGASSPTRSSSSTDSAAPSTSADGMITAFASDAEDLASDHPAGTTQIYIVDRRRGITRLVSRADGGDGAPGAGSSSHPSISADGRYVAFATASNNISDDDATGTQDVYVRDIASNTTKLVSRGAAGPGDADSVDPEISPDGRYVVFSSRAGNLGGGGLLTSDVFLHDRSTGATTLVSKAADGGAALGDSVAPDVNLLGGVVVYESTADNIASGDAILLRDVFAYDVRNDTSSLVSRADGADGAAGLGGSYAPSVSADGRYVAFESDANFGTGANVLFRDVFVRDRAIGTTTPVSRQSGDTGTVGNGTSDQADISPEGGFVAFRSAASNLSSVDEDPDTDVFVRALDDGALSLASRAKDGPAADGDSSEPSLAAAAGMVVYASRAGNLVSDAPSGRTNVFSTTMRSTLGVLSAGDPVANAGLTQVSAPVNCSTSCFVWATAKLITTDGNGVTTTRNGVGYGAEAIATGGTSSVTVYLMPNRTAWLKNELAAGKTATVEIKIEAFGMRGEKSRVVASGPIALPAAVG